METLSFYWPTDRLWSLGNKGSLSSKENRFTKNPPIRSVSGTICLGDTPQIPLPRRMCQGQRVKFKVVLQSVSPGVIVIRRETPKSASGRCTEDSKICTKILILHRRQVQNSSSRTLGVYSFWAAYTHLCLIKIKKPSADMVLCLCPGGHMEIYQG